MGDIEVEKDPDYKIFPMTRSILKEANEPGSISGLMLIISLPFDLLHLPYGIYQIFRKKDVSE